MATTFKTLLSSDIVNTRNFLHESVPITGTIVSGTYNNAIDGSEYNIKNYSHGQFQSVFDYPYLSSSANHLFDISEGLSLSLCGEFDKLLGIISTPEPGFAPKSAARAPHNNNVELTNSISSR